MSDLSEYFIKSNYVSRNKAPSKNYWDGLFSRFVDTCYQYPVYENARDLVLEENLKSVVDVGCGLATKLMDLIYPVCNNVLGVDQKRAIEECKKKYKNGRFLSANFEDPPGLSEKFDLVICADVIEHLINPDYLLGFIKSLCDENTFIIFSTPERDIFRGENSKMSPYPNHIREWNQSEFKKYLNSRGYRILNSELLDFMKRDLNIATEIWWFLNKIFKGAESLQYTQYHLCKLFD